MRLIKHILKEIKQSIEDHSDDSLDLTFSGTFTLTTSDGTIVLRLGPTVEDPVKTGTPLLTVIHVPPTPPKIAEARHFLVSVLNSIE